MSTAWCYQWLPLRVFKGRGKRSGRCETCNALPASEPYLQII